MSARLVGKAAPFLRQGRPACSPALPRLALARHFTHRSPSSIAAAASLTARGARTLPAASKFAQKRSFAAVSGQAPATQPAPNPKFYLDSGVIKPEELADVKKVLVVGSGGLAIGQAGEFDYSGTLAAAAPRA